MNWRLLAVGLWLSQGCATTPPPTEPSPAPAGTQPVEWHKPTLTDTLVAEAEPRLEAYLRRVLGGTPAADEARTIELVRAYPFAEGHTNETWYLAVDIDGEIDHAALKIFRDADAAAANEARFRGAVEHGWPIPTELVRNTTAPYSDRPSLLMEFMVGGSLRTRVKSLFGRPGNATPAPEEIADLYGEVGELLGRLHRKHTRPREPADPTARPAMETAIARCTAEGWCGDEARTRLRALAAEIDGGEVTFCHNDLYESQIIMAPDNRVRAFIDLDTAGYADPAADVGSLLGHILLVNPAARAASWKIPAPSKDEVTRTARQVLLAYRASARITDSAWPSFLRRVRAHAWLRLATLGVRYAGNPHAKPMLDAITAHRQRVTAEDPFDTLGEL